MNLSLVIPCYNEAKNIPLLLEKCVKLNQLDGLEVILVDNGSTDNTEEVLTKLMPSYPHCRTVKVKVNKGYGNGILEGLRSSTGDVLAWTHADMQTDPADTLEGFKYFKESESPETLFVKGKRYGRPIMDVFFTMGMSIFESLYMNKLMSDINAQPTMFPRELFNKWDSPPKDFSLDLFAYYTAKCKGFEVKRFPVRFGKRAHGVSHWNIDWRSKLKFIKRTFSYSVELKQNL